jgi:hypothetical protein
MVVVVGSGSVVVITGLVVIGVVVLTGVVVLIGVVVLETGVVVSVAVVSDWHPARASRHKIAVAINNLITFIYSILLLF